MKELNLKLYSFGELKESSKKSVIERMRNEIQENSMDANFSEYLATLKEFSDIFGIKVYDIDVTPYSNHFRFEFKNDYAYEWYDGEISNEDTTGKLLLRWINNNVVPYIYENKVFFGKFKYENGKFIKCIKRVSRILLSSDCPLTGCCYDYDILNPLYEYLQKPDFKISLYDLVNKCLTYFFGCVQTEYEYCGSDDYVSEELQYCSLYENNLYFEDGTKWEGPELNELSA